MAVASDPPPIPPPNVPVIDPKTGLMNPVWYQYLVAADKKLRSLVS